MSGSHRPEFENATPLVLRTLGGAGLYAHDGGEPILGPGKPLALLIYLALTPGRRISREFLIDLLWADLEPERARNALRQAIYQLRRLIGEQALSGSEELTLARRIDTDRDLFLGAVERGDLEPAVEAYRGDFLPDFGTPGGAAFERWADLERDRLRTAFFRAAELLVRRRLNASRFKDAQRLARRVRDELPDAEPAWRLLLESIIVARDFVAAAVEADALEAQAGADGTTLEPATRAMIARARQVTAASVTTTDEHALVADLTGREREFAAVMTAWEATRAGHGRHLHASAPAGLGKTRLLRDVASRLRAGGAKVVDVRGTPGDRDIPYAFAGEFAMAIAGLPGAAGIAPASASALVALNPALSSRLPAAPDPSTGDEALRRRIQALADLVQSVAYEQPIALVIDDLHWADAMSYRVLEGLFPRCVGTSVLCLTASRPERAPVSDAVTALVLAPLTVPQVGSLVGALASVPDGPAWSRDFVAGLHAATGGSPLLILQTLRLALDEGVLALEGSAWRCVHEPRLATLLREAEALRHRVRSLPELERWVLAVLATAGSPLEADALTACLEADAAGAAGVRAALAALERHGLVVRMDRGWAPAHDEIADAARASLDAERQRAANRVVARVLIATAGSDAQRLLRAIRHAIAAGEDDIVRVQFARYAVLARTHRDRRPFAALAAEVLGAPEDSAAARDLARRLPMSWRAGLWSGTRRLVAATVAVAVVVGLAASGTLRASRAAALPRLVYADATGGVHAATVDPAAFDGTTAPVATDRTESPITKAALDFPETPPLVSPDGRSFAWNIDAGDSTTLDIWLRTPAGVRRLTNQPRDDKVYAWVPDGSALIGVTNRWTTREAGNYDIAIFDTATGVARQVTSGRDHDGEPVLSPDGTRIAFVRESTDGRTLVCVVPFDARSAPDCRLAAGEQVLYVVGWSSLTELVLITRSQAGRPLVRYDWARDHASVLLAPYTARPMMSPDRRSVVVAASTDGIAGLRDWIVPLDAPDKARLVDRPNTGGSPVRWWEGRGDRSLLIDRIEFTDSTRTILPGIGTRMGVRALTAAGTEIPLLAPIRWSSSDTLVATVDSLGDVHPRAVGRVRIAASLAGWRRAERDLEVRGAAPSTVLDEQWDDTWKARWITFGEPAPVVTTGPGGARAFWNHGDGDYLSFALSRQGFDATRGLGVEVRLATPITRDDWQRLRVIFVPGADTAALQKGDQKKAPVLGGDFASGCGVRYPAGAGQAGRRRIAITGGGDYDFELDRTVAALDNGAWWTVRLQILPDGRCAVAINGKPIWLSPERLAVDGAFRLHLGDESLGTALLHGPLKVWTGVRTDVDWMTPRLTPRQGR